LNLTQILCSSIRLIRTITATVLIITSSLISTMIAILHINIKQYDLLLDLPMKIKPEEWCLLGCYAMWLLQEPHGLTSQKTPFFIVTAVKTSNLTK
jgi:hypothetical protein